MPERMKTFASLGIRNYRYFFLGALVSNLGTWIQRIGQDWLVLTDLTDNSSTALGIVTALQFLAIPLLAPFAGSIIDRYPKRKVLVVTQIALMLNALSLWALVATGTVELWHVYGFALQEASLPFDTADELADMAEDVYLPQLPPDEFPYLNESATVLFAEGYDPADEFTFGLDLVLAALEPLRASA